MQTITILMGIVTKTLHNEIHTFYASSKEELSDKIKEWVEEMFHSDLEDFDASNALRFIKEEEQDDEERIGNNDQLVSLYNDHLKEKNPDDTFTIFTTEHINISVNDRLEVMDVDSE